MTTIETPPDFGVIDSITLPSDGKMPDGAGTSSRAEYDRYFRLERRSAGLAAWSRTCLQVQRNVLRDLAATELTAEVRYDILAGCVTVLHSTLERWLDGASEAER